MSKALTYASYLKIDELLTLQKPRSEEHDEMLFIVIHQVYELWFKQLLHEFDALAARLEAGELHPALGTLRRILTILKTIVAQIDVLETMTPLEFGAFRDRLGSASGFQSQQFRELEFLLGHKRQGMLEHFAKAGMETAALERRYRSATLWDAFLAFLRHHGFEAPARPNVTAAIEPDPALQRSLIALYRQRPDLARLCERLVDVDEGMMEWRYRHVKMVERTIGRKKGTGGSSGADYLKTTIRPLWPDLWEIRSEL
jgi:tryptophan 2,3-dioxygenase